jgi:NAD(P)-dependent dehydrogenase (short-subunit alcohol dehydrogenase family)
VHGLAKELGPRDITVNAVAPGHFGAETEQSFQAATRLSGAGRLGEWDEIVPLIAFLCTPTPSGSPPRPSASTAA